MIPQLECIQAFNAVFEREYRAHERYGVSWLDPRKVLRDGLMQEGIRAGVFPRSEEEKMERMTRFMEWKRRQIFIRWRRRILITMGVLVGTPLALGVVVISWNSFFMVTLG